MSHEPSVVSSDPTSLLLSLVLEHLDIGFSSKPPVSQSEKKNTNTNKKNIIYCIFHKLNVLRTNFGAKICEFRLLI